MRGLLLAAALALWGAPVHAQSDDADAAAILEVGAAASHGVSGGAASFGPSLAIEWTPIEHWLELEAGVTPLFRRGSTEWNTDLLFKKPWTLTRKFEFMVGVGPEWVRTKERGAPSNQLALEGALDLMYWPSPKRRFGWYIEPAFDYSLARGHEKSVGVTAGLLISIR